MIRDTHNTKIPLLRVVLVVLAIIAVVVTAEAAVVDVVIFIVYRVLIDTCITPSGDMMGLVWNISMTFFWIMRMSLS